MAQAPTNMNVEGDYTRKLMSMSRNGLVEMKIEAQIRATDVKRRISVRLPFPEYKALESERQSIARNIVLIDRELCRRKLKLREEYEKAQQERPASRDAVDWPREFLSVAKQVLSPEQFGLIEAATERHVAEIVAANPQNDIEGGE